MQILFIDWPCYGKQNAITTLQEMGHTVCSFSHPDYNHMKSSSFEHTLEQFIGDTYYDLCFSFNYFPLVSNVCQKLDLKYISVTYDSPYVFLYSPTILNEVNYAFTFDKQECLSLRNSGIPNIYYTPLPANTLHAAPFSPNLREKKRLQADVSFVGSLYTEKHNLYDKLDGISDYAKGYLEGMMQSQLKVHGYNFLEEALSPDILAELDKVIPFEAIRSGAETPNYLYANYFLCRRLTAMERKQTLSAVSSNANLNLYTWTKDSTIPNASYMGAVDYYTEMPYLFANSKINLNITLRSIKSGIPLRALDIMGAGGFLLTNFQEDFLDYFIPGEDFIYYESNEDLIDKIHYLLEHDNERLEIAHNGYEKVNANHNCRTFFENIFNMVFQ